MEMFKKAQELGYSLKRETSAKDIPDEIYPLLLEKLKKQ